MRHYNSRLRRISPTRRKHSFFSSKTAFLEARLAKYIFFGLIALIVIGFGYVLWVSRDLPTPGKLANGNIKDSTRILDKNGKLLYSFYKDYNRIYVNLDQIPETLRNATIATEDKDFYRNKGFSITGTFRGVVLDPLLHGRATGGSTITQQLVKIALLSSERSLTRKLKELILAVQVDSKYSKDQILEMYLNNIPYGGTAVGIEAASNLYFGKHAKDLTLAQSAFLAGLPQLPTFYSPYSNPDKTYIGRSQDVLERMRAEGYISQKEADAALAQIKQFTFQQRKSEAIKAPHFVMYVRQQLVDMFGENYVNNGNLTIKTTLDSDLQTDAESIVTKEFEGFKNYKVKNAAVMVEDVKTGGILAMIGSEDYFNSDIDGQFNAATALRQPGSSLKPIMYSVAFEKGYTPATLVMDVKTDFPTNDGNGTMYSPVNYDGKFRGPVQLRFALGNSYNVPAVKMLARVGIKPVMQKAFDMGITNWEPTADHLRSVGLSLVLGGREATLAQITSAYSVFARQGEKKEMYGIQEVDDTHGKVLYKHQDKGQQRVLSQEVAFLISHILLDNNARLDAFGPNSWLVVPGRTVAVKTGTTDQKRDNWTIGYTPSYTVGVWVGNNDNTPLDPRIASGITGASPIWNKVMSRVLKGTPKEEFKKPDNVIDKQIDAFSGGLPIDGQPTRVEYFIKGTEPSTKSPIYMTLKMSKHDSGKLASDEEVSRNDYDTIDVINFIEDDPVSTDGKNRWQEAIDAWVNEHHKDDPKYKRPTDKSDYHYDNNDNHDDNKSEPTPTPTSVPATPTPTSVLPTIAP
jgi:1A family penicillin-binding protein